MSDTTTAPVRISEREAAARLGVVPQTLRNWRKNGYLRDGLLVGRTGPNPARPTTINYDGALVDAIVAANEFAYKTAGQ